ncbi:MAG: uroporphyrinogen-III synthase [Neisseria sp.]|nr:uroporphyrinogen-III synthase [Neisseria sp.]
MTDTPLVVVTRPHGRADNIVHECARAGWSVRHVPLMRLQEHESFSGSLNAMAQTSDAVFFVSPSAVEMAAAKIDWTRYHGTVTAVGHASATALQAASGKNVLYPHDGNDSEALLRLPLWRERSGRLLIVRGAHGRDFFAEALRKLGWTVDCADVYRRVALPVSVDEQQMIFCHRGDIAVLLTSAEAARTWVDSLAPQYSAQGKRLLYFTIHPRIGDVLRCAGMESVEDHPAEDDIIAALRRLWNKHEPNIY